MTIELQSALSQRETSLETCLALGATWEFDGKAIPPLSAGHVVLIDMLAPRLLGTAEDDSPPNRNDAVAAMAIIEHGQECVTPVFELLAGGGGAWCAMRDAMQKRISEKTWQEIVAQLVAQCEYAFAGTECIDWGDSAGAPISTGYDGIWLAHIVSAVSHSAPALHPTEIIWHTPMALCTHLAAATARTGGADIHRPIDLFAAMEQQQEEKRARIAAREEGAA